MTIGGLAMVVLVFVASLLLLAFLFTVYVLARYRKHIYRIFEENVPFLAATPGTPPPDASTVWFQTPKGRKLAGSYRKHRDRQRRGVVLFCHEYRADRWLCEQYVGYLRDRGFDIFTFDFCNHGQSEEIAGYHPMHWTTQHEVDDVTAALHYLKSRPDIEGVGIGLFGVSRGGGAGIIAAANDPGIRAIVTDGAFPTRGMVIYYEMRWVQIFVGVRYIYPLLPRAFYWALTWYAMLRLQRRHGVRYASLERAIRRRPNQPLLMIHGGSDNYIHRDVIERLFARAGQPKELWVVPKAKHNRCLERAGDEYRQRVGDFFVRHLSGEQGSDQDRQRLDEGADLPSDTDAKQAANRDTASAVDRSVGSDRTAEQAPPGARF